LQLAKGGCLAGLNFQTALELSIAVTLKYSLLEAIKQKAVFLNVQTIADANLKIRDIVARWPGSAHDSYF
jgi:hypothetical protein